MRYIRETIFSLILIIASLILLNVFKVFTVDNLWDGYSVLYIPCEAPSDTVLDVLYKSGVRDFISIKNQKVPLSSSSNNPVMGLSLMGQSDYLSKRNIYFFDKDRNYCLYYIPESYIKEGCEALSLLKDLYGYEGGLSNNVSYPFIALLTVVVFALILSLCSKKRILSLCTSILPVYFIALNPLYHLAGIVCLMLYGLYLAEILWKLPGSRKFISKDAYLLVIMMVSTLFICLSGYKCLLLFLGLCMGQWGIMKLYDIVEKVKDLKYSFVPVRILRAAIVPVITKRSVLCLFVCTVSIACIFCLSINHMDISPSIEGIHLPSNHGEEGDFPSLRDYIDWKWETETFPYISVNDSVNPSNPKKGDTVFFPHFNERNGVIGESFSSLIYGTEYDSSSINSIDELNYPALEKLLKDQGNIKAGYVITKVNSVSYLSYIMLLVTFIIPVIFYLTMQYKLKKGARRG